MKINLLRFVMRALLLVCFAGPLTLVSCQEDPKIRILEQEKEAKKQEAIFNSINQGWRFNAQTVILTAG